jgi:hypothetical protein
MGEIARRLGNGGRHAGDEEFAVLNFDAVEFSAPRAVGHECQALAQRRRAAGAVILRRDDAELGHMRTQRVDQHRALPDQQWPSAMQHQHGLLLGVFTGTKRIDGRVTASQIASASAASFLLRLT